MLLVDRGDEQFALGRLLDDVLGGQRADRVAQRELLDLAPAEFDQLGTEDLLILLGPRLERPVLARHESLDLFLALADQAQRGRLHAPGGQTRLDLAPQQRRQIEAHQIVQRAARLLGIDQGVGDLARMLDRVLHLALGDLVEHHALDRLALERVLLLQQLGQVPGDRLPFTIRVGREPEFVGILERGDDGLDVLFVLVDDPVLHLEAVLDIDRAVLGHEVADVTVRREDFEVLAQVFLDRLGLGGRLDDNQIFAHVARHWWSTAKWLRCAPY